MNAFAPAGLMSLRMPLADHRWSVCRAFLSWDSQGQADAEALYRRLVGQAPQHSLRNKFPTATFPCRVWACGQVASWRYDLRLGVHGQRDEFEVTGQAVRPAVALGRLLQASRLLPWTELGATSLHLDLELYGEDASTVARDWGSTLCPPADLAAGPQVVETADDALAVRVTGELHDAGESPFFVLRAEVLPLVAARSIGPAELIARLNAGSLV